MAPAIPAGAVVTVDRSVPFLDLKEGDVIKIRQGWTLYAHRIISVRTSADGRRYVVTRGDNERATEVVTAQQYLGRVILK